MTEPPHPPAVRSDQETGRPSLGEALRALRLAGGISQEGWAARLGIGRRTVVRWEQGETVPDAAMEDLIIAAAREKALFRPLTRGPWRGLDLTPGLLRDLLAGARLAQQPAISGRQTVPVPGGQPEQAIAPGLPTNLPAPLTSFIGREAATAEVVRLLAGARLLTLTGSGGCGKTRLAIEVARRLLPAYPGGVWWVDLSPLTADTSIAFAVAGVLGIREQPGRNLDDELIDTLRARRLLLVLDNCEHVVDAAAALAGSLLPRCPQLTVLATSRTPLRAPGETIWWVPSLATPDPAAEHATDVIGGFAAVQLFVDRARSVRPGFALSEDNAAAIAHICHQLDGIPLAIELAAARLTVLSATQIAARLDDRFRLLTTGNRAALPRHQTLRAVTDWSHDLLSGAEQRLFARLAVFGGGFTLEAVEAVTANDFDTSPALDRLGALVDHSLVVAAESGGEMRYRLLETLRAYAAERLAARDDAALVRDRHRDHYLALAEQASPRLRGPEQARWVARLEEEHDNLRIALRRCLESADGAAPGLRLAVLLTPFWVTRGHLREARGWLETFLARDHAGDVAGRVRALLAFGGFAIYLGEPHTAEQAYTDAVALARETEDRELLAGALTNLGMVRADAGDTATAWEHLNVVLKTYRASGNRQAEGTLLHNLGFLAERQDDLDGARRYYEASLALRQELGDALGMARTANTLGGVLLKQGDIARARSWFEQSLTLCGQIGDQQGRVATLHHLGETARRERELVAARRYYAEALGIAARLGMRKHIADNLEGLAAVLVDQPRRGARLLGAVGVVRAALAGPQIPAERQVSATIEAGVQARLGAEAFAAEVTLGRVMPLEQAISEAMATPDRDPQERDLPEG